jgi:hypothetical protein
MKITIIRSTNRAKKLQGVYIDHQSALFCPFHVLHPDKEGTKAHNAYKWYLYQVIDKGAEPALVANALSKKFGLLISARWKPVARDAVIDEAQRLAQLAQAQGLTLVTDRDLGAEHGLKAYLEWKYPAPEQQTLKVL